MSKSHCSEFGLESSVYNFLRLHNLLVLHLFYAKKTFLATLMLLTMHDYFFTGRQPIDSNIVQEEKC